MIESISHYRILEKVGGGGMGVVSKAEDTRTSEAILRRFSRGGQHHHAHIAS